MRPRDEECRGLDTKRKSKQDRRAARRAKKHATRNKQRKQSLQCYEHDDDNGDDMNTTMTVCVFESEAFCANAASFIQNGYGAHLSADTDFMPAKIDARSHHQFPGSSSSVPRKVSMRASSMLHPRRRVAKSYPRDFANPTQCDIRSRKRTPTKRC